MQRSLSIAARSKLYLILAFASLALLFYEVAQIAYVVCTPSDMLGLVSHFTLPYWIGLGIIFLCSVLVFLDKEFKNDVIFVFILIVFGMFLFSIATLVQENVRLPTVYGNVAEARNLLANGYIDITTPSAMRTYGMWPAVHFIAADTALVANLSLHEYLRYIPFFWLLSFIFITYCIGQRIGLSRNLSFALSFLALSSYWLVQSDSSQQAFAYLIYLLFFLCIIQYKQTVGELLLLLVLFLGSLLTHGVTTVAIYAVAIVMAIYHITHRIRPYYAIAFTIPFLIWGGTVGIYAIRFGIQNFMQSSMLSTLLLGARIEGIWSPAHTFTSALIAQYSQIAFLAVYAFLCTLSVVVVYLTKKKVEHNQKHWIILLIILGFSIALSAMFIPSRETWQRAYILCLIPMICIVLIGIPRRWLVVSLMIICTSLCLPARYALESYSIQVLSSDLAESRFFAEYAVPIEPWYFFNGGEDHRLINFWNPDSIFWKKELVQSRLSPEEIIDSGVVDEASYVITTKGAYNSAIGRYGEEVIIDRWQKNRSGSEFNLIYTSGVYNKVFRK